jgi:hypothetical protein
MPLGFLKIAFHLALRGEDRATLAIANSRSIFCFTTLSHRFFSNSRAVSLVEWHQRMIGIRASEIARFAGNRNDTA